MLLVPSSLQNSNLTTSAKRCIQSIQHRLSDDYLGIDGINPSGVKGDEYFGIITPGGVLLLAFKDISFLANKVNLMLLAQLYQIASQRFTTRLLSHSALKSPTGALLFPVTILFVFADASKNDLPEETKGDSFIAAHCRFKDWLLDLRTPDKAEDAFESALSSPITDVPNPSTITETLRDVIINRIAPWATIPKITQADIDRARKQAQLSTADQSFDLPHDDSLVDILRLDKKQVDEVNAIKKGHQLILACAGSGKSVIMIAKCFKLASLDKKRKFIILCYNKNLRNYYRWQIDEAGFSERNVECFTIHQLFNKLLNDFHLSRPYGKENDEYYDAVAERVVAALKDGTIPPQYYGIFIDEVQIFKPIWYRACCLLLEDLGGSEHILTICGDLTQNLKSSVKSSEAPWQGEGLPVFRGHTIHIETNYRNSIQINDFVNIYAGLVKSRLPANAILTMDTYLRGKAFRNGFAPIVSSFNSKNPVDEAMKIVQAVQYMHDEQNIGFSEIAILIYNGTGNAKLGYSYPLLKKIQKQLSAKNIPYTLLAWSSNCEYALRDGVSVITYEGSLGIDYRGIVVGGISLIGTREGIQHDTPDIIATTPEAVADYRKGFDALYIACTRAKDSLALVLPSRDAPTSTVYSEIVHDCIAKYRDEKGEVIDL